MPVEIGPVAGSVPPGAVDDHRAVAPALCIMVSIVGGERLPAVIAQGVPWQGGTGGSLVPAPMPGTLEDSTSQEPQNN